MRLWYILSIPKCKNIFRSAVKYVIKINKTLMCLIRKNSQYY
jgi:uncharacterized C2H2 Zn-finger protein